ncbi:hypothetical protein HanRHA438_Chr05g0224871 [Helianthus annuus]|nr:hypothetical protein HanRHA438_Chr05g0224871 [Helianthus annuus]
MLSVDVCTTGGSETLATTYCFPLMDMFIYFWFSNHGMDFLWKHFRICVAIVLHHFSTSCFQQDDHSFIKECDINWFC